MKTWQTIITGSQNAAQRLLIGSYIMPMQEVALLCRNTDGDWETTSPVLNTNQQYLASADVSEKDAKALVEAQVYRHYTNQKAMYTELCNTLCLS